MLFTKTPVLAYKAYVLMAVDAAGHSITLKILGLSSLFKTVGKRRKKIPGASIYFNSKLK